MYEDVVSEGILRERMKIQGITKPLLNRYAEFSKEFFGTDLMAVAVFGSLARGAAKFLGE